MAIEVACQCGARFQIPDHLAGKSAPCPKCGNQLLHTVVIVGLATTVFLITQYNQNPESVGTPGLKSADGSDYSDKYMPDGMAQQNSTVVSEADAIYFKDHPLLLNVLKTLASDHAVEFEDLSTIEGYEAFVRSPEYQQWLQFQNQLQL